MRMVNVQIAVKKTLAMSIAIRKQLQKSQPVQKKVRKPIPATVVTVIQRRSLRRDTILKTESVQTAGKKAPITISTVIRKQLPKNQPVRKQGKRPIPATAVTAIRKRFLQRGIILWMVNVLTAAKKIQAMYIPMCRMSL